MTRYAPRCSISPPCGRGCPGVRSCPARLRSCRGKPAHGVCTGADAACQKSPYRTFLTSFPPSILKEFKMLLPNPLIYQGVRRRFIRFEAGLAPLKLPPDALISDFKTWFFDSSLFLFCAFRPQPVFRTGCGRSLRAEKACRKMYDCISGSFLLY